VTSTIWPVFVCFRKTASFLRIPFPISNFFFFSVFSLSYPLRHESNTGTLKFP
jgi:hypothetical protein